MPIKSAKTPEKRFKKPLKIAEFVEHCFPARIFFCANEAEWRSLLADQGIPDEPYPESDARLTEYTHPHHVPVLIITISERAEEKTSVQVIGMLVHELVHVKQYVEERMYGTNIGDSRTRFDIETEAYFMQAMVMWVFSAYADSGRGFKDD